MSWFSAGLLANPVANTILADTGAMTVAGSAKLKLVMGADVGMVVFLEQRNAANSANINSQVLANAANSPYDLEIPGVEWAAGERFRLRLSIALTGSAQASIFLL
jgi:hypothetical protein